MLSFMRGLERWVTAAVVVGSIGCARNHAPPRTIAVRYEGPIRSRDVVEGGRIYITLCTACHRGRVNPRGYTWSAGQMRHQIREGNRLMPPLNEELLSDSQVEAVLAYLSVMGALEGELPPAPDSDEGLDLDDEDAAALAEADAEDEAAALADAEAEADEAAEAAAAEAAEDEALAAEEQGDEEAEDETVAPADPDDAPREPTNPSEEETGDGLAPPGGSSGLSTPDPP